MINIFFLADYPIYAKKIQSWFMQHWGISYPQRTFEDWQCELYFNKDTLPITIIAICQDDNELVGCASLCFREVFLNEKNSVWLERLYVDQKYRKNGVATQLVAHTIKLANSLKEKGYPVEEIKLLTRSASNLYEKNGWSQVRVIEYQGGPVSFMTRKIGLKDVIA